MKTQTNPFDFDAFVSKLKRSFFGFEFEEEGHPDDPENPPCFIVAKPGHGCCGFYNPNYNPQCQKPNCIVAILFNDKQTNMSLDGLLIVPINLFDDFLFIDRIKQLLRFKVDTTDKIKERQSTLMLLSLISHIEEEVRQTESIQLDVHLIDAKAVLNRKELINYFS